jgi:curved DNA-binding protein CbpA
MDVTRAYSMLGVPSGASLKEIRSAYRNQLRRIHPDTGGLGDPAALASIRGAYRAIVEGGVMRVTVEPVRPRHIDVYA